MVNHPNRSKRGTNPDHKCLLGYVATCSCGWRSSTVYQGNARAYGLPGARASVLSEWRAHREWCERNPDRQER